MRGKKAEGRTLQRFKGKARAKDMMKHRPKTQAKFDDD